MMDSYNLYAISSDLSGEVLTDVNDDRFLVDIQQKVGCVFRITSDPQQADFFYIRTGGAERKFMDIFPYVRGKVRLLASGSRNSLAASVEILSWLNRQNREGEILHGNGEDIARKLNNKESIRLGVIGEPSDWLISSTPDEKALNEKLNISLIRIKIEELIEETKKEEYSLDDSIKLNYDFDKESLKGALNIYGAMKRLIGRYNLDGVTVRCFDLLGPLHNTGCLALAILNSEGIPAACEGDIPALVSMMVARKITGFTGFQANPSRIDIEKDEIVFAHCTAPLNILSSYTYDTHFESGIGVAIKGKMNEGPVTIFKLAPDLSRAFVKTGTLIENLNEQNLCRTQIRIQCDGIADYLLHNPIGNHHIIIPGDWSEKLNKFI